MPIGIFMALKSFHFLALIIKVNTIISGSTKPTYPLLRVARPKTRKKEVKNLLFISVPFEAFKNRYMEYVMKNVRAMSGDAYLAYIKNIAKVASRPAARNPVFRSKSLRPMLKVNITVRMPKIAEGNRTAKLLILKTRYERLTSQ